MKYFLDTNIIINFINKKEDAIKTLKPILEDNNSEIFINRLVRLESLRTITYKQQDNKNLFNRAKEILDNFTPLEITPKIYKEAKEFSRYCTSYGIVIKGCALVDYLHFITAKHYKLEMLSDDKDMETLEENYQAFLDYYNT